MRPGGNYMIRMLALALLAMSAVSPALAQSAKIFVASTGNDSNDGGRTTPKRSFQAAHDAVATGGEVVALDTAGYGTLTITKSVGIVVPPGVNGFITVTTPGAVDVTINAGANDRIQLSGLIIEGAASGTGGVAFNSGGSLTIADCSIRGHETNGVVIKTNATSDFFISNSVMSENGGNGLLVQPTGLSVTTGTVQRSILKNNVSNGIQVDGTQASGGSLRVAVHETTMSRNRDGLFAKSITNRTAPRVIVESSVSSFNNINGFEVDGENTVVTIGRSSIVGNGSFGVVNGANGGSFKGFRDSHFSGNGTDNGSALTYTTPF